MRRSILSFVVLLVSLFGVRNAFGWLSTGHRIVADIAWAELTPPARAWASDILKQHPRYTDDLLLNNPDDASADDTARYAFESAATWPDMVRSQTNPMHAEFNHPNWHYIDIPYSVGGQAAVIRGSGDNTGPKNIVEALAKNVIDLEDPKVAPADKAVALCWILHLCGDIHQPLHATELFSSQFPTGDQGGNLFLVLREPPYADSKNNLHFIWDSMPGDFQTRDLERYIATGLRSDSKYSRDQLKGQIAVVDFMAWANESHDLAIKYAYANGQLRGIAKGAKVDPGTPTPGLTHDYMRNAEQVANRRIILAGYRTADLLNSIFTSATTRPAKQVPGAPETLHH